MVGQLVHGALHGSGLHPGHVIPHGVKKGSAVALKLLPAGIAVLLHSRQEPGNGFHEGIVIHDAVPLISLKPGRRVPVMLGDQHCIRIGRLDSIPEIPPELMVHLRRMPQVGRHVQAPAVRTKRRRHPLPGDLQNVFVQAL